MAIMIKDPVFQICDSRFISIKYSGYDGGAIFIEQIGINATLFINTSVFCKCSSENNWGGALYVICFSFNMDSCCFRDCFALGSQNYYFVGNLGYYKHSSISCSEHTYHFKNSIERVFSLFSLNGQTTNSNCSDFLSLHSGFFIGSSYLGVHNNSFNMYKSLESTKEYSFSFKQTEVHFIHTNFLKCSCDSIQQMSLMESYVELVDCVIIECPKLSIGLYCIDCFFDIGQEANASYIGCSFFTKASFHEINRRDCYGFYSDCAIISSKTPNSTFVETEFQQCYQIINCEFFSLSITTNGGAIYIVSPLVAVSIFTTIFFNCSSYCDHNYLHGGAIYFSSKYGVFNMTKSCGFGCYSNTGHMAGINVDDIESMQVNLSSICMCSPSNVKLYGASLELSFGFLVINSSNNHPDGYSSIFSTSPIYIDHSIFSNNVANDGMLIYSLKCTFNNCYFNGNDCALFLLNCHNVIMTGCIFMENNVTNVFNTDDGYIIDCIIDFDLVQLMFLLHVSLHNVTEKTNVPPFTSIDNDLLCRKKPVIPEKAYHIDEKTIIIMIFVVITIVLSIITIKIKNKQQLLEESSLIQRSVHLDFG